MYHPTPTHQPLRTYRRPKTAAEKVVPTTCEQPHGMVINPVKIICNHMIGEQHSIYHRFIAGSLVMLSGVVISKSGTGLFHYLTDLIGYGIHGIGLIPFVDKLVEMVKNR